MSSAPGIISYCDIYEVKSELGLGQDSLGNWIVWGLSIDPEIVQHYVVQANEVSTNLFGDLTTSVVLFPLAKQYATKVASLRLIQTMSVNWIVTGLQVQLGDVGFNRLPALQAGAALILERLKTDIDKLYVMLSDVTVINAYQPSSPYVVTGGSSYWA